MEREKFTTVDELDKYLEEDLARQLEPEVEEETEVLVEDAEETEEVEDTEETVESEDVEEVEEVEEAEEVEETKPVTKHEKQRDYAFAKLRQEAKEAKERELAKEKELSDYKALTEKLMKEAGFSEFDEFKEVLNKQFVEKEMKDKGLTKEQYDEIAQLRAEKKALEDRLNQTRVVEMREKATNIDNLVKKYSAQAKVSAGDVYGMLQQTGYTVDTLLGQPNPEILIKGILADKLNVVKTVVKKQVDTKKHSSGNSGNPSELTIDDLVKMDLAEMAKKSR